MVQRYLRFVAMMCDADVAMCLYWAIRWQWFADCIDVDSEDDADDGGLKWRFAD